MWVGAPKESAAADAHQSGRLRMANPDGEVASERTKKIFHSNERNFAFCAKIFQVGAQMLLRVEVDTENGEELGKQRLDPLPINHSFAHAGCDIPIGKHAICG
jgi:hypothetical protein